MRRSGPGALAQPRQVADDAVYTSDLVTQWGRGVAPDNVRLPRVARKLTPDQRLWHKSRENRGAAVGKQPLTAGEWPA